MEFTEEQWFGLKKQQSWLHRYLTPRNTQGHRVLVVYFMQQWFNLSDPRAEDALYDIEPMRRFAGIELTEDTIPNETTILRFRPLLEEHQLTGAIFQAVQCLVSGKSPKTVMEA